MRIITILCMLAFFVLNSASAHAQAAAGCQPIDRSQVETVVNSNANKFKFIGIRRPAVQAQGGEIAWITIRAQSSELSDFGRYDDNTSNEGKVVELASCPGKVIQYKLLVVPMKDAQGANWHVTEIPLPEGMKSVSFQSCSAAAQKCFSGKFEGDDSKYVTLTEDQPVPSQVQATKMRKQYN